MTKRDFIWLAYPDNVCEKSSSGVFGCPTLYGLSEDCNAYSNCEDCWDEELGYDVIAEAKEEVESSAGKEISRGEKVTVKKCEISDGVFWAWSDRMCWLCVFKDRSKFKFYLNDKEDEKMTPKFELKPGMKVRVRNYDKRPFSWNSEGKMDKYMGKVVTVRAIECKRVKIKEDKNENCNNGWYWNIEDFIPVKFTKSDLKDGMMLETENGERYLWLYGERRDLYGCLGNLPEEFSDEAKSEFPQYEVVKVGYPDIKTYGSIEDILKYAEFKEVLWDKEWNKEAVKEITAEEAAKLLKEKFPEYDAVKITV